MDAPSAAVCYGAPNGLVKPCFASAPAGDLMLPATIDTDTSTLCGAPMSGGAGYCVLAAGRIQVDTTVAVTGSKPLVLVAAASIEIPGGATIDVASHHTPPKAGPGADPVDCMAGSPPTANTGGGGGAGGSFGGAGGAGGAGNAGTGAGGTPSAVQVVSTLRGGCPGQSGINGTFGVGGKGGGARPGATV